MEGADTLLEALAKEPVCKVRTKVEHLLLAHHLLEIADNLNPVLTLSILERI